MKSHSQSDDKFKILEMRWSDSMFDERLFLTKDGRKRGLWIWLEENHEERIKWDEKFFDHGLKELVKTLREEGWTGQEHRLHWQLRMYFDLFFGHRTEARAFRMAWSQVKKLAMALADNFNRENKKTEEDCDPDATDDE